METLKKYHRLTSFEREEISRGLARRESMATIAGGLGRETSTICREVARNSVKSGYRAFSADNQAIERASSRRGGKNRIAREDALRIYVHEKLKKRWSPRQIVKRLEEEYPFDMAMRVSHETIYQYIYVLPRGSLKATLIKALRQERKYRRTQKRGNIVEMRGKIADMLSIEERPAKVADPTIPGDWEGDLIIGKHKKTAIGTLVERTTRYTIIVPLKAKDAESVRKAYAKELGGLPTEIAKTLTYDQGKEMSGQQQKYERSYSPVLPQRHRLSAVSVRQLKRVQRELNDRPRTVLNYKKPDEAINQLVALKV